MQKNNRGNVWRTFSLTFSLLRIAVAAGGFLLILGQHDAGPLHWEAELQAFLNIYQIILDKILGPLVWSVNWIIAWLGWGLTLGDFFKPLFAAMMAIWGAYATVVRPTIISYFVGAVLALATIAFGLFPTNPAAKYMGPIYIFMLLLLALWGSFKRDIRPDTRQFCLQLLAIVGAMISFIIINIGLQIT